MPLHEVAATVAPDQWAAYKAFDRAALIATREAQVLQLAADAVIGCRLYRCVVISLHDAEGNLGPIGFVGVPADLIEAARRAPRVRKEVREAVLQERFRVGESYFLPIEAGIDLSNEARHIAPLEPPPPGAEWQAGDELFTPLRRSDGDVMGFSSVDQPFDGRRPRPDSLRLHELIIGRAAIAIEHITALRALATATERVQRMAEQSEDVAYLIDATTGRFLSASPAIHSFTGNSHTDIPQLTTGDWIRRFVHPEDREKVSAHFLSLGDLALAGSSRALTAEYRVIHQSGAVRWVRDKTWPSVDEDGQVTAFEGLIRDITSVQSLAGRLAQTEERYRLIADNVRDLIYTRDTAGYLTYVSPSVRDYLEVGPEEFVRSHFSAWLSDDPRNRAAFEAFDALLEGGANRGPFTLELQGPTGRRVLMEFNESLVHDALGRVIGTQGVGRDVTEREQLLRSLEDQKARLDASTAALKSLVSQLRRGQQNAVEMSRRLQAKNADLEYFVHIVSHDLRAPLITLQGLGAQLRRRYARLLDPRGRETITQIGAEARRLMRLITDLLDYARAGADESARRAVDVGLITDSVWSRIAESDRGRDATLQHPDTPILVWVDPVALERVMENLLSNAITHRSAERAPVIDVDWHADGREVEITVRDNGPGIEAEDCDRIFELFYRGRGAESTGSGLGLAIVKRILDASSGSIACESTPGTGATFRVRLPAHPSSIPPESGVQQS